MNNCYYRAKDFGNFGDDLNPYIFNHFFGELFSSNKHKDLDFHGIGTVIDSRLKTDKKIVLFGSGIRDITLKYNTSNWDIRFLRGPITSNILGFMGEKYIADGAYSMLCDEALMPQFKNKRFKFSIMPHFRQMDTVDWELISSIADVHIINPRADYQDVLNELMQTEFLLSVAMHGAIVADILRIPWQRIKMEAIGSESPMLSDLKWLDFLSALDLKNDFLFVKKYHLPVQKKPIKKCAFYIELVSLIKEAKRNNKFQLTSDNKLNEVKLKIGNEIQLMRKDYQ